MASISQKLFFFFASFFLLTELMFWSAKGHIYMHILNMLVTSVQKFKLVALKLWKELIIKTCYHIKGLYQKCLSQKCRNFVKHYLSTLKHQIHILNMLVTSLQSFVLIAWNLWDRCWSLTSKLTRSTMPKFCQNCFFLLQKVTCISSVTIVTRA